MSRFYVLPENVQKNEIFINGNEAHHILSVMRLKESDRVVVFDGTGKEYTGFIKTADKKCRSLIVEIIKTEKPLQDKMPDIVLAQAIPKKDKMDYILEKATELGVSQIVPVITKRTIVRLDPASAVKKRIRWEKITTTAAKQCGRVSTPEIRTITSFERLLVEMDTYDLCLIATLQGPTLPIKNALSVFKSGRILILIGPEGGFAPEELGQIHAENCKFVSLGKNILKSDTAGLFVLSAMNYEFSDRCL